MNTVLNLLNEVKTTLISLRGTAEPFIMGFDEDGEPYGELVYTISKEGGELMLQKIISCIELTKKMNNNE